MEEMQAIRREIGASDAQLQLFDCDLSDPIAVEATAQRIVQSGISVDSILNNAAIDPRESFERSGVSLWSLVLEVNLLSAVALTQSLLSVLRRSPQGRILSEAGSGITGQAITIDGGLLHPLADVDMQGGLLPNQISKPCA